MYGAIAVCGIWIGYGVAVLGVSFGTGSSEAALGIGVVGAFFAMLATWLATDN